MNKNFLAAVEERRTFYDIGKAKILSDEGLQKLVETAVLHSPTAFNSQLTRAVLLLESAHDRFWDITKEALRKIVPAEKFAPTEEKINSFAAGGGTVLFFEETDITKKLQSDFPIYKDNFPVWAEQANGMLQFVIWTALEAEGYGASLQHYNELVAQTVKDEWGLPSSWRLIAQMPFGNPVSKPSAKDFSPIESRVRVYK